ncbi:hypothetical protein ASPACDRAFT_46609 [Aspergillus aculeatus ATCC 16872]|uniref:Uncharacterized protein n=1 Tax=Aspergillus aculeatus (strain ATCC 16872 / CBS 172.66 / WB 5094) TaxID=690307 RepID=A0A1L9WJX3_ASPA1|nr:uncharacterized protein ASPACDRAFT_46609 [Aspergillus aculeatus ATCC 16872]OJJ96444.1 hypothetical protein ASPACDRAFT_46609 [Aspergillus aculeatus ATCC 16872]
MASFPLPYNFSTPCDNIEVYPLQRNDQRVLIVILKCWKNTTDDWLPAMEILRRQWWHQRQAHPHLDRKRMGGVLISSQNSFRMFTESPELDYEPQIWAEFEEDVQAFFHVFDENN